MKKSRLSLLITLAIVPIANCGIGGIPGNLTLNSVGPGKSSQSLRESTKTSRKHEGPFPQNAKRGFQPVGVTDAGYNHNLNFNLIPNENKTP